MERQRNSDVSSFKRSCRRLSLSLPLSLTCSVKTAVTISLQAAGHDVSDVSNIYIHIEET